MADPITYDQMRDLLLEQARVLNSGSKSSSSIRSGSLGSAVTDDPTAQFRALRAELDRQIASLKKMQKETTSFAGILKNGAVPVMDVSDTLNELDDQIKKLERSLERVDTSALEAQRAEIAKTAAIHNSAAAAINFSKSMGSAVTQAISTGAKTIANGLTGAGSSVEMATSLISTGLDAAGQASNAAGSAVGTLGGVLSTSTNKSVRGLGIAASIAGPMIGKLGETASKVAKFAVEILGKEVEKTVKAFNQTTAAGAVFADGMTGMRNAASEAGMTVEQFSNTMSKHSADLGSLGMGVTEGAKRVGGALRAGGDTMQMSLRKLGFSMEEQAGLVAETMKDMRGSGGPLRASNAQVAEQTQKYAENLRAISAITGEDAKQKMEQVRQQTSQLSFQQKLAGMSEEQRAGVRRAMANMSDLERKNFMDMVNFGTVINREGAAAAAMSEGLTNSVNASYRAFQDGKLDDTEQRRISAEHGEQAKRDLMNNSAIALAGAANVGGLAQSLAESMGKELEFRNAWTQEAIKNAEEGVQGQKDATDKLTSSVIGADVAMQQLKSAIEKEMLTAIGSYAKMTESVLGSVQKMLAEVGIKTSMGSKEEEPGWLKQNARNLIVGGATGIGAIAGGLMAGTAAGVATAGVGAAGGAIYGGMQGAGTGAAIGTAIADFFGIENAKKGYADGGVASGPTSGYIRKLHGSELIVPMSGGALDTTSEGFKELLKISKSPIGTALPTPPVSNQQDMLWDTLLPSGITNILSATQSNPVVGNDMTSSVTMRQTPVTSSLSEVKSMGDHFGQLVESISKLVTGDNAGTKGLSQSDQSEKSVRVLEDILVVLKEHGQKQEEAIKFMDESNRSFERLARAME